MRRTACSAKPDSTCTPRRRLPAVGGDVSLWEFLVRSLRERAIVRASIYGARREPPCRGVVENLVSSLHRELMAGARHGHVRRSTCPASTVHFFIPLCARPVDHPSRSSHAARPGASGASDDGPSRVDRFCSGKHVVRRCGDDPVAALDERALERPSYCPALMCSSQSTGFLSSFSWMATWVMAVVGAAPFNLVACMKCLSSVIHDTGDRSTRVVSVAQRAGSHAVISSMPSAAG